MSYFKTTETTIVTDGKHRVIARTVREVIEKGEPAWPLGGESYTVNEHGGWTSWTFHSEVVEQGHLPPMAFATS